MSNPTDPQGGHTAKSPTLTHSDETGFAEPTPEQQDRMMKALGAFAEAWSPRSGKILEADASLW